MEGSLVKWIHDYEPTNLCVILKRITEKEPNPELGTADEQSLYMLYDFITSETFYALEDEIDFIETT